MGNYTSCCDVILNGCHFGNEKEHDNVVSTNMGYLPIIYTQFFQAENVKYIFCNLFAAFKSKRFLKVYIEFPIVIEASIMDFSCSGAHDHGLWAPVILSVL